MTPHFTDKELACQCGCGMLPDAQFMHKVEVLRDLFGQPMRVTSAARCPAHNAIVSTTGRTGPHTTGHAIDIAVTGADAHRLLVKAILTGMFTGLGVALRTGPGLLRCLDIKDFRQSGQIEHPYGWIAIELEWGA